jgi:hypothetical protein
MSPIKLPNIHFISDMPLTIDSGPIGFISLLIFLLSWPKPQHLPTITRRPWKEFDYVGSTLIIAAAVLAIFPFQSVGESQESASTWATAAFIAPLIIGLILWLALVAWGYLAKHTLKLRIALTFPITLFTNRTYTAAALSTLCIGYPYFMLSYAFPLRAQVIDEKDPLLAGVMLLPMLGATAVGTILAGILSKTKNYLFETMLVGACLLTVGAGLLTTINDGVAGAGGDHDDAKALGFIVFVGMGFGLNVAAATMITAFEAPIVDYGKISPLTKLSYNCHPGYSELMIKTKHSARPGHNSPTPHPRRQPRYININNLPKRSSPQPLIGPPDRQRTSYIGPQ